MKFFQPKTDRAARFALLLSASYAVVASIILSKPGLQYDELQFANVAMGSKYTTFIYARLWGVPAMLMPYYSALKSYLYYPIFSLFGFSAWSVRLPMILLTAVGLYLLWRALRGEMPQSWSLAVLALLAFDPSLISLTRLDVGPNAIEFFCKAVSLFFFFRLLRGRRERDLYLMLLFLGIGVVNKINFIWYINAFTVAAAAVYYSQLREVARKISIKGRVGAITLAAYIFYYGFFWWISKVFHLGGNVTLKAIHDNWPVFAHSVPGIISGQTMFRYLFGESYGVWSKFYIVGYAIVLLGGAVALWVNWRTISTSARRLYIFSWIIVAAVLAQILVTEQATAPWHYLEIYPFTAVLFGLSLYFIATIRRRLAVTAVAVLIVAVLFEAAIYSKFIVRYADADNWYWSTAITRLAAYTSQTDGRFVSIDWGTQTQLIGYDDEPGKYIEVWQPMAGAFTPAFEQGLLHPSGNRPTYFIAFNTGRNPQSSAVKTGPYPQSNANFLRLVADSHSRIQKIRDIRDSRGHVIYEIFALR